MATKLDIWNLALGNLRAGTVGSEAEFSVAALNCRLYYDVCKQAVLLEAPWKFASQVRPLPQLSSSEPGWAFAYQLPPKTLRVWGVRPREGAMSGFDGLFDVVYDPDTQKQVLVTDLPSVEAKLTHDVDEGGMPPHVTMALAHLLASYLATPLAGTDAGSKLQETQLALYSRALAAANSFDSSHQNLPQPESRYITARR